MAADVLTIIRYIMSIHLGLWTGCMYMEASDVAISCAGIHNSSTYSTAMGQVYGCIVPICSTHCRNEFKLTFQNILPLLSAVLNEPTIPSRVDLYGCTKSGVVVLPFKSSLPSHALVEGAVVLAPSVSWARLMSTLQGNNVVYRLLYHTQSNYYSIFDF